jgi:hypothetical protein
VPDVFEGAGIEVCQEISSQWGTRLLTMEYLMILAFDVGLMSEDKIEIFVRKLNNEIFSHGRKN